MSAVHAPTPRIYGNHQPKELSVADENKWSFDSDYEDCNERRSEAIQAEAQYKAKEVSAAGGDQAAVAEANGRASVEVARVTAQAQMATAESQRKQAKVVAKWQARASESVAQGSAREAEARYVWVHGLVRVIRLIVIGAVLVASFYFTPNFWPDVVKAISATFATQHI